MSTISAAAMAAALVMFNFILYFIFGLLLLGKGNKEGRGMELSLTMLAGFFFYYSLFTLFAVPVTYRWRPLSLLTMLWCGAMLFVTLLSLIIRWKRLKSDIGSAFKTLWDNKAMAAAICVIVIVQIIIVLYSYQFTLDAAYYVANVTTSLRTNSLNIYDPYTGDWQNHFEMRYFFATYPLQDAVMCSIFKVPALIQTKLVMAATVIILANMLYYMIGKELFGADRKRARVLMLLFAGVINFFFITIYTSSNFLLTRTYEGKSILGNVVLPAMLYIFIRIIKAEEMGERTGRYYLYLFIVCFGSTVISNSSNMLVPAALAVMFVPFIVGKLIKKEIRAAIIVSVKMIACMLPGIILMLVYVAYVKGMFILYTYPK